MVEQPVTLRQQLVDAGAGTNFAAGGQRRAGEQVAGLRTVDISLLRLFVVEAPDDQHLFAEIVQWREHFPQFHLFALAFRPPFLRVKAVAGKQHRKPHRRFAGGLGARDGVTPDGQ